jgi:hypothetical protein
LLVGGRIVRLEPGKPSKDQNGRLLAYVFVGKTCVNEELVRQGFAHIRRPVAAKYKTRLIDAQEEARKAGRGIWVKVKDLEIAIVSVHARIESDGKRNLNDEYIVIKNRGDKSLELTGWTISDESSNHRYLFPNYVLPAGAKVTLRSGLGSNTGSELFWGSRRPIWNDDGDTVFIKDAQGNLVLSHIY